jgi:hypothetical protein
MPSPTEPPVGAPRSPSRVTVPPDLEQELRQAWSEFERGECIELTPEQLDRWADDGVVPWPEEFQR